LPTFRPPQVASLVKQVPAGNDHLLEMKCDCYHCQGAIAGGKVAALHPLQPRLDLDRQFWLAIDQNGRSNFTLLENSLDRRTPVVFFASGRSRPEP
jgi:hypothetical protein